MGVQTEAVTVLQVGEGRFLRGFLGPLVTEARERGAFAGALVLTAPRPSGSPRLAALRQAEGYRLVIRGEGGEQTHWLSPYDRIVDGFAEPGSLRAEVTAPRPLIIVSNTTEAGLTYREEPRAHPGTYPARLTAWLQARREAGVAEPVCVIPCELLAENARLLRSAVERHATDWGLPAGLLDGVAFAETLVDRIVTSEDPADGLACFTEPYAAWYIGGAPGWVRAALPLDPRWVHFVDDVTPARDRKVRLLNGTHTLMAALGLQMGVPGVHEALGHPLLGSFLRGALYGEGVGSFPPAERPEALAFADQTLSRFLNPGIRDTLRRLALQLTAKVGARWTPILEGYRREQGRWPERFSIGLAAYLRLLAGEALDLATLDDPAWVQAVRQWRPETAPAEFVRRATAAPAWPGPRDPDLLRGVAEHFEAMEARGLEAHLSATWA